MTANDQETPADRPGSTLATGGSGSESSPSQSWLGSWWAGLGRGQRAAAVVLAAIVLVNLAVAGGRSILGGSPGGPVSSSFSTGGDGLEAYADLLVATGHPVERLRDQVSSTRLAGAAAVVVADPEVLTNAEVDALVSYVTSGGRLVVAGEAGSALVPIVSGADVEWFQGEPSDRLSVWLPADGFGGARELAGDRGGRWTNSGGLMPVAGAADGAAVVVGPAGQGEVVALADSSVLQNQNLAVADNAAFGLAVAGMDVAGADGQAAGPVVFVESAHGYATSGLDAVPSPWKWASAGLAVALVIGLWSAGSRFGPAEPRRRALRPPRLHHVEAVAADLDRVVATPAEAARPLTESTRVALAERLGVAADASPGVLYAAAEQAGVDTRDVELVVTTDVDLPTALAIGSLAAARQRSAAGLTGPPSEVPDTVPVDPHAQEQLS